MLDLSRRRDVVIADRRTDRRSTGRVLGWALAAVLSTVAAVFFGYYTTRLIYINAAGLVPASRREPGMYIGGAVFPLATLVFSYLGLRSGRAASRATQERG
ncbi:MAG: hypothetical protein ABI442_09585 [Gemmatimonadaceae bacterium]